MRRSLRRLSRDRSGVAMIEFAVGLPIFLGMLITGLETVNLIFAHQQVSRIAISTADLAARYRASIDEADVKQLFLGARLSADTLDFSKNGRLILSSVMRNNANSGHWVRWQRCEGQLTGIASVIGIEDAGKTNTTIPSVRYSAGASTGMVLSPGDDVMAAEATYEYQPIFLASFKGIRIRYAASFMARELALPSLTNSTNLPTSSRALCG
jgi:Flp pilus assembly protein TadG